MLKNILIVDHESNLATALEFLLGHAGFNVTLAGSYAEADAALERSRPDLALIDAALPDRSGYDLCQAILGRPGLQHLPILMLTTRSLQVEREKALSLGASDFIVKPFDPAAILHRVQELLREAA